MTFRKCRYFQDWFFSVSSLVFFFLPLLPSSTSWSSSPFLPLQDGQGGFQNAIWSSGSPSELLHIRSLLPELHSSFLIILKELQHPQESFYLLQKPLDHLWGQSLFYRSSNILRNLFVCSRNPWTVSKDSDCCAGSAGTISFTPGAPAADLHQNFTLNISGAPSVTSFQLESSQRLRNQDQNPARTRSKLTSDHFCWSDQRRSAETSKDQWESLMGLLTKGEWSYWSCWTSRCTSTRWCDGRYWIRWPVQPVQFWFRTRLGLKSLSRLHPGWSGLFISQKSDKPGRFKGSPGFLLDLISVPVVFRLISGSVGWFLWFYSVFIEGCCGLD